MTSVLRNSSIAARPRVADFSLTHVEKITEKEIGRCIPQAISIAVKDGSHSIDKVRIESLGLHNLLSKGLLPGKGNSATTLKKIEGTPSISISNTVPSRPQTPGTKPGDEKSTEGNLRKSRPQSKPVLALEREIYRKNEKTALQSRGRYVGKEPPSDGDGLFIDKKPSKGNAKSRKSASTVTGKGKSRKGFFF